MVKLLLNQLKRILLPRIPEKILRNIVFYNYNCIDSVLEVNGIYYIKKVKSVLSHFNYVHCGVETLSMSRRIMNKVFSCADENNIHIYYQDTDSIHLNYDDVDKVVEGYKGNYGLELVGEELGYFHVDFDMDGADSEIYAIESLVLGKATYIYSLESTDKDGKTISSEHIGMKGIPTPCIKYYAQKTGITVLDVYKQHLIINLLSLI